MERTATTPLTRWFHVGRLFSVRLEHNPRDFWLGAYYRDEGAALDVWLCLLPFFPVHLSI